MALYAYEDVARTKKILARETTERNKGIRYYCPNSKCNARMFLWSLNGESRPFFRASAKYGHVQGCPYGSDNTYNPEETQEEGFDSDDLISKLMVASTKRKSGEGTVQAKRTGEKKRIVPHTIKQIYDMCKSHYCKDTFNGQVVGQILLDTRSIYMYPKGIFGYRIIEAKCKPHLYDNTNIYLETPLENELYSLKIHFKDHDLFKEIRKLLFDNRQHVIVVAGKWESSGEYNCFVTEMNCKKQIKVMKQEV